MITGVTPKPSGEAGPAERPRCAVILIATEACPDEIRIAHSRAQNLATGCQILLVCGNDAANVATAQQLGVEVLEADGDIRDPGNLRRLGKSRVGGDLIRFEVLRGGRASRPQAGSWPERLRTAGVTKPTKSAEG